MAHLPESHSVDTEQIECTLRGPSGVQAGTCAANLGKALQQSRAGMQAVPTALSGWVVHVSMAYRIFMPSTAAQATSGGAWRC